MHIKLNLKQELQQIDFHQNPISLEFRKDIGFVIPKLSEPTISMVSKSHNCVEVLLDVSAAPYPHQARYQTGSAVHRSSV